MNFDEALTAHTNWKMKLSSYLRKPDGTLHPQEIEPDNKCDLGKWIVGEGAKFSALPTFRSLKAEHARFHKAAADIVRRADSGAKIADEMALGADSEFGHASRGVVQAIMSMRQTAH
jgi:methyl-accepting chemotaxis protein